jgi:hypothetical protein
MDNEIRTIGVGCILWLPKSGNKIPCENLECTTAKKLKAGQGVLTKNQRRFCPLAGKGYNHPVVVLSKGAETTDEGLVHFTVKVAKVSNLAISF